jgi:hypothetical protein
VSLLASNEKGELVRGHGHYYLALELRLGAQP